MDRVEDGQELRSTQAIYLIYKSLDLSYFTLTDVKYFFLLFIPLTYITFITILLLFFLTRRRRREGSRPDIHYSVSTSYLYPTFGVLDTPPKTGGEGG